jgi:hypothetical protein
MRGNQTCWSTDALCGQKTNSVDDAHFEAITDEGCIFSGDRFYEDELLLCQKCYPEEAYERVVLMDC